MPRSVIYLSFFPDNSTTAEIERIYPPTHPVNSPISNNFGHDSSHSPLICYGNISRDSVLNFGIRLLPGSSWISGLLNRMDITSSYPILNYPTPQLWSRSEQCSTNTGLMGRSKIFQGGGHNSAMQFRRCTSEYHDPWEVEKHVHANALQEHFGKLLFRYCNELASCLNKL